MTFQDTLTSRLETLALLTSYAESLNERKNVECDLLEIALKTSAPFGWFSRAYGLFQELEKIEETTGGSKDSPALHEETESALLKHASEVAKQAAR